MRTRLIALGTVFLTGSLALTACSAPSHGTASEHHTVVMNADYPVYEGVADAGADSDVVVKGTYTDSRVTLLRPEQSDSMDPHANPQAGAADVGTEDDAMAVVVTVSEVRVEEVVKGDVAVGDVIEVSQLGGTYDGTTYQEEGTTLLPDVDGDVVLLLAKTSKTGYDPINPDQGVLVDTGVSLHDTTGQVVFNDVNTVDELKKAITR
ncbi:hypothetical protein AABM26_02320 [Curtobacterium aetherium]|uniref:hypothetical protein n=1 Tax=Curtobacterium aetherium TaxID=2841594 RepID=UPI003B5282C6